MKNAEKSKKKRNYEDYLGDILSHQVVNSRPFHFQPVLTKYCSVLDFDQHHGQYYPAENQLCPKCNPEPYIDPKDNESRKELSWNSSFKPAGSDWDRTYSGLLQVSIYPEEFFPMYKGFTRVVVAGSDYDMFAKHVKTYAEAVQVIQKLPSIITKCYLLNKGFVYDG